MRSLPDALAQYIKGGSRRCCGNARIGTLGAGLAGLSAAYQLTRCGHQVTVIEKEQHVGGMATSFQVDGIPATGVRVR